MVTNTITIIATTAIATTIATTNIMGETTLTKDLVTIVTEDCFNQVMATRATMVD